MAIGKVISKNVVLFPDFDDFEYGKYGRFWDFELFLQIPNITKTDILEYFEYIALGRSISGGECDSHFVPMCLDSKNEVIENDTNPTYISEYINMCLDSKNEVIENDTNPTYISEYINIVGQLFLAGYIDFGLCNLQDKEENLLSRQRDTYQAWIHFRDNFFYTDAFSRDITEVREKYPNISDDEYIYSTWDTPQYWDKYRFWIARTPKGDEYFEKVLAPRFYNKYKDLEVEIDSKGNIVRWIGRINR